jgi:hypothetical protein
MPEYSLDFRPLLGIHLQCIITLIRMKMKPFYPIQIHASPILEVVCASMPSPGGL